MRPLDRTVIEDLDGWRPPHGVISVFLEIDPGQRGDAWRIEARERLARLVSRAGEDSGERRKATEATAARVQEHFSSPAQPSGRIQIGFCEVAVRPGREIWLSAQMQGFGTRIAHLDHPLLTPLAALLDEGSPVGIAAVSSERVRLFQWELGMIEELAGYDAGFRTGSWRERKSQSTNDPAHAQGVSSSGRDQFDQRLEANRERFLQDTGRAVAQEGKGRGWRALLAFGDPNYVSQVAEGAESQMPARHVSDAIIVSEDRETVRRHIDSAVGDLNRDRERELVERARAAALSDGGRGSLGRADVQRALQEGRVAHLLLDAEPPEGDEDGTANELLIEEAVRTGAEISPVEGEAAEKLRETEGVAALLRY